ncbi:hypothetical protein SFUMM280S_09813 [Streptomyces fumanus]
MALVVGVEVVLGGLGRAVVAGPDARRVAMIDTEKIQPPGKVVPKLMRPGIRIGRPLDFSRYQGMEHDRSCCGR